jgi:hypothetical protein
MVPQLVDPSDDRVTASTPTAAAGDGTALLPDAMVSIESSTVVELRYHLFTRRALHSHCLLPHHTATKLCSVVNLEVAMQSCIYIVYHIAHYCLHVRSYELTTLCCPRMCTLNMLQRIQQGKSTDAATARHGEEGFGSVSSSMHHL